MGNQILNYKELFSWPIEIYLDGSVYKKGNPRARFDKACQGKMLYFDVNDSISPSDATWELANNSSTWINCVNAPTLYVSKKSKIPRDILRNSGYKITLSPDNADAIVIPSVPKGVNFYSEEWSAIVRRDSCDSLYLINIRKGKWYSADKMFQESHVEALDKFIHDELFNGEQITIFRNDYYKDFRISFVPECEEYKDLLLYTYPSRKYVMDNHVHTNPAVEINLDTLITWKQCREKDILQKAIINSDYVEYPLTLAVFLSAEKSDFAYYSSTNAQMKRVLEYIEYDKIDDSYPVSYEISPKDYALLQKWIMYKLNLPENGGWVNADLYNSLSRVYMRFLKTRIACTCMKLSENTDFKIVKQEVENTGDCL